MNRKYLLIISCLLISLFIYLFYRTEKTVVTGLFIGLVSDEMYNQLKASIVSHLPLNDLIVYSLPEGLWVFCITLTSNPYYISLGKRRLDGCYVPLIFCLSLELMQLLQMTNGRFDWQDIAVLFLCWLMALGYRHDGDEKQALFTKLTFSALICFGSYGIVYLAHVIN